MQLAASSFDALALDTVLRRVYYRDLWTEAGMRV